MQKSSSYLGFKIKRFRKDSKLTQAAFAAKLGISAAYLNQIEHDDRPVSANVLIKLAQQFQIDVAAFTQDNSLRLTADLREALADPLFGDAHINRETVEHIAATAPEIGQALLTAHQVNLRLQEQMRIIDDQISTGDVPFGSEDKAPLFPYEEVRDYFHYKDNYIDALDKAAEETALTHELVGPEPRDRYIAYLKERHDVRVDIIELDKDTRNIRAYDGKTRRLTLASSMNRASQAFQLAYQIARLEQAPLIEDLLENSGLSSNATQDICRIGLSNYFAGALLMPYTAFAETARKVRHDAEILQRKFGASFEQVWHRLSNLQRPGAHGVPFFFVRVDLAGNITKRHSATKFQFARFGGACPIWNVHNAFTSPGHILTQIAETPDAVKYLSVAKCIIKHAGHYDGFDRYYAVGLGCEISHASEVVYGDNIDTSQNAKATPIGISCRICERQNCPQRAFPPVDRDLYVDSNARGIIPYKMKP